MLDKEKFEYWCAKNNLSPSTIAVIERIRTAQPSRSVRSGRGVSGRFPSGKMGVTIQFESHKNELPFIYELEHDSSVIEFYDQPAPIKLTYSNAVGRNLAFMHTPDFFVIYESKAAWVECKTEEDLLNLSVKQPNRYRRDQNGEWHCLPGEAYATTLGLHYMVRSSREINWIFQRNIEFLEDYFRGSVRIADNVQAVILQIIKAELGITLQKLFEQMQMLASRDDVFALIANELVFVDLNEAPLDEPERVLVFNDRIAAEAFSNIIRSNSPKEKLEVPVVELKIGALVNWDGKNWRIVNIGVTHISLIGENEKSVNIPVNTFNELAKSGAIEGLKKTEITAIHPEITRILQSANAVALATANRRLSFVLEAIENQSNALESTVCERSLRRWRNNFEQAKKLYGNGFIGLIPKPNNGNRKRKISNASLECMQETIESDFETIKQKRLSSVYGKYLLTCEEKAIQAASYKTFCRETKKRPQYEQTYKRMGKRAAYKHKEFYWYLQPDTPRHGSHPFHIAHIDHTELDVELNDSQTGKNFARPWITLLVDAFSRRILAFYITFNPPSKISCMMVIRECVRRHGRLPQTIVVDGGKEFGSVYFEALLAVFESTKKVRPPAEGRFGSVMERLFGTNNTQFIHNLAGNTQIMKNVRQVTKSVNPKNHSIWTLPDLTLLTSEFLYEVYDNNIHSTLGESPMSAFTRGIELFGERASRLIAYGEEFEILTLPEIPRKTVKVESGRGIKVHYVYYFADAFRHPDVENTRVAVRFDPWDAGRVYAFVRGKWVVCHSEYYQKLQGRSTKEIEMATEELRRRKTQANRHFNMTAAQIARFLSSAEAEELLIRQRIADRETKTALRLITGGAEQQPIVEIVQKAMVGGSRRSFSSFASSDSNANVPLNYGDESSPENDEPSANVVNFPDKFTEFGEF